MITLLLIIFLVFISLLISLIILYKLWWIPLHIQRVLESQGIKGPPYKILHGNSKEILKMMKQSSSTSMELSHDVFPKVCPHWYSWMKIYGNNFVYWSNTKPHIVVTEPEMMKEILDNKGGMYLKFKWESYVEKLLGDGIASAEGERWSKLRKISNHAFHGEPLKDMFPAMINSVETMLERWGNNKGKEIEVCEDFRLLTSEVISRTAFGSNYLEGMHIFQMLTNLAALILRNQNRTRFFAIQKLWRTQDDIEADRIDKFLCESIMDMVKKREDEVKMGRANNFGSDFLGSLIKAHHDMDEKNKISVSDIIGECKTIYFAGQETTQSLLCWIVLVLSIHTDWQDKARKEVIELFGQEHPNSDGVARLKTVNMIINETLRLYNPVNTIPRRIDLEAKLGKYQLPPVVNLIIPPPAVHRNPDIWGEDAHLFKPERFSQGLSKATNGNAMAFLPFGYGTRMCVGMNFAYNETKITLSMILQRYKFTLSPNYVHSPCKVLTTKPQHGVRILLQSL